MAALKLLQEEAFCIFPTCNFYSVHGLNLLKYLLQTKELLYLKLLNSLKALLLQIKSQKQKPTGVCSYNYCIIKPCVPPCLLRSIPVNGSEEGKRSAKISAVCLVVLQLMGWCSDSSCICEGRGVTLKVTPQDVPWGAPSLPSIRHRAAAKRGRSELQFCSQHRSWLHSFLLGWQSAALRRKQAHFVYLNWNTEFSRKVQTCSKRHTHSLEHCTIIGTHRLSLFSFVLRQRSFCPFPWVPAWYEDNGIVLSCLLCWSPNLIDATEETI